jgi:hypothetical protein
METQARTSYPSNVADDEWASLAFDCLVVHRLLAVASQGPRRAFVKMPLLSEDGADVR